MVLAREYLLVLGEQAWQLGDVGRCAPCQGQRLGDSSITWISVAVGEGLSVRVHDLEAAV